MAVRARLIRSVLFGRSRTGSNSCAYHDLTKTLNTPTALSTTALYSPSQSTVSPVNERCTSLAAQLADSRARVTPEEKIGSRNSAAFPVSAHRGHQRRSEERRVGKE